MSHDLWPSARVSAGLNLQPDGLREYVTELAGQSTEVGVQPTRALPRRSQLPSCPPVEGYPQVNWLQRNRTKLESIR
jgi:hypothetical protein